MIEIFQGDCRAVLSGLGADSFHACVTDPPAGIAFMGRNWDSDRGGRRQWVAWMTEVAREVSRVCKPGAHALVWSLPRTSHWTGWAWEDADWVPRDCVYHLFGSGFPKSLDVSKAFDRAAGAEREVICENPNGALGIADHGREAKYRRENGTSGFITAPATEASRAWQGWGTALKPAAEQWWLFRKPLSEATVAANVLRHGTGALNIDACRVATDWSTDPSARGLGHGFNREGYQKECNVFSPRQHTGFEANKGRWPANVAHDGSPEVLDAFARFGERSGQAAAVNGAEPSSKTDNVVYGQFNGRVAAEPRGDTGTAARFFFCAKADASERVGSHPTVKPVALMEWLVQLVTPPGGRVLDPFCGTGSTLVACERLGFDALGIEQDAQTVADAHEKLRRMRARRMIGDVQRVPIAEGQLLLL